MIDVVVYGAGGHGKVVADILLCDAQRWRVLGFIDDGRAAGETVLGLPVLGCATWLHSDHAAQVALGIGDNAARERAAEAVREAGRALIVAIHPTAVIARSARLGGGTVVMANAAVNADARVGAGAILNTGCVVEHDCVVGDFAHVSPKAGLGGGASVGRLSHVGLGAVILPRAAVGERCVVGAGSVVLRVVADDTVVAGVPARTLRRAT